MSDDTYPIRFNQSTLKLLHEVVASATYSGYKPEHLLTTLITSHYYKLVIEQVSAGDQPDLFKIPAEYYGYLAEWCKLSRMTPEMHLSKMVMDEHHYVVVEKQESIFRRHEKIPVEFYRRDLAHRYNPKS